MLSLEKGRFMRLYFLVQFVCLLLVAGCGGDKSDPEPILKEPSFTITLKETELIVDEQIEVQMAFDYALNTTSIDSILWQQISGFSVELNHADDTFSTFLAPTVLLTDGRQKLAFRVTVTGQDTTTISEDVIVYVDPINRQPVVNTTVEYINNTEQSIILTAIASDEDGDITNYLWQQLSGDEVTITNNEQAEIQFSTENITSGSLSFSISVTDNEGVTVVKELGVNIQGNIEDIITQSNVSTLSGTTTIIEWQNIGKRDDLIFELVQVTGEQKLSFNRTAENFSYFDAPLVQDSPTEYQLSLNVRDSNHLQFNLPITLSIAPSDKLFSEVKTILAMDSSGIDFNLFTTEDIDNDGVTDIIAYEDKSRYSNKGVYWFNNYGDFNINFVPNLINEEINFPALNQHFFEDIDNDSLIDFIFIDYESERNSMIGKYRKNEIDGSFFSEVELFEFKGTGSNTNNAQFFITSTNTKDHIFAYSTHDHWADTAALYLVEQEGDTFISYDRTEFTGEVVDVQSCQLGAFAETAVFIHLSSNFDRQHSLYVSSSLDNYK